MLSLGGGGEGRDGGHCEGERAWARRPAICAYDMNQDNRTCVIQDGVCMVRRHDTLGATMSQKKAVFLSASLLVSVSISLPFFSFFFFFFLLGKKNVINWGAALS